MEIVLLIVLVGLLLYIRSELASKIDVLDFKLTELNRKLAQQEQPEIAKPKETVIVPEPEKPVFAAETKPLPAPVPEAEPEVAAMAEWAQTKPFSEIVFAEAVQKPQYARPTVASEPQKSWWEDFKEKNPDLEKFIGENLINKIGVLILVLGISYFVKFAIDKDWINEPARAGIGILSGALVMGFAHKLRKNYAAFSSVLVAGAIAIFYFTIGIAFHDYHLFGQTAAFVIMVAITAFSCLISLSYDRKELAVLSLIGGFAVPFMVATGEGNYVVLFVYIGILALASSRKWIIINILSYIFTVVLYGSWLAKSILDSQPHYLGALVFGFVFYFIFTLINIINNLRSKGAFSAVELSILASNTFLFYAAGMVILSHFHPEFKGLFTTMLALLNLLYAWFLYKKFGMDRTAVYLLIGLTLTFATLAIPIQFNGNYITLFWAAEAVLLLWLAQKSKIASYRFGSVVVHFLMAVSLVMDWKNIYTSDAVLNIVANPAFITGAFALLSLLAVQWLLKNESENMAQFGFVFNPVAYRKYALVLSLFIGYFTGILETAYQAHSYLSDHASAASVTAFYHLLFFAVFCLVLSKRQNAFNTQLQSIIASINMVLFALWFSRFAFAEHREFMATNLFQRVAFCLHYLSLLLTVYFGIVLYRVHKKESVGRYFSNSIFIWIAAAFVVYLASTELMLHGLVFSGHPVTAEDLAASQLNTAFKNTNPDFVRETIANRAIADISNQVIRTGFPVLWGILAFVFLILGIKRQIKPIRIVALALLGVTILKLFLFDIRNASETGKIIAFILLGVLILIISFVYQKIKVLVLADSKPPENDEAI